MNNNLASPEQRVAYSQCTPSRHTHRLIAERIAADERRALWQEERKPVSQLDQDFDLVSMAEKIVEARFALELCME